MQEYSSGISMEEVLESCREGFLNISGQDLLFSRDFTKEEFSARRKNLAGRIGKGAHMLVPSAPPQPGHNPCQDASFYYLTGLELVHSHLLINGDDGHCTLFVSTRELVDGVDADKLGYEDADLIRDRLMVDEVKPTTDLTTALSKVKKVYVPFAELEGGGVTRGIANMCAAAREQAEWDGAEPTHKRLIRKLEERFPGIVIENANGFIGDLRRIKTPSEIKLMRQGGHLSALIMIESMKATKVGMCESRLEAIARYIFASYGNCDLGYGVIAASGKRIVNGHYHFNNQTLEDGEVVLMDCGPDLRHYSSDIARLWPVNGKYSDWHRKVYGFIVEYHKVLLKMLKPGPCPADIYVEAAEIMRHGCKNNLFECGDMSELLDFMVERGIRYYNHGVGMSVHDAISPWRDGPLEEGMVIAVDPMVTIQEKSQYIRVEDTVVITRDGCERLTGAAPFEMNEIEELMKQPSEFGNI